jgi:limonene-1,2-epoxide hydrolase
VKKKQQPGINRRAFLTTAGVGAVALGFPRGSEAAMTPQEKANIAVVNKFLHYRWYSNPFDADGLAQLLAEDCVRGGADPTKNLEVGRDTIVNSLKRRVGQGEPTRYTMLVQEWAAGAVVIHERYECPGGTGRNGGPASIDHGVGVFHVKDGKIKEWRWFDIENRPDLKVPKSAYKPKA